MNRKGACSRCLIYHRLDLTMIFHGMLPVFSGQAWTCPFARIWLQCLYCHQSHFWPFFGLFYFPFYFHLFGVLWELRNTTHLFERFSVVLCSSKKNDQVLLDFPQNLPVQNRNALWVNIAWLVCIAFNDSNVWSPTAWTNGVAIAMWPKNFFMPPCRKHHNKQNWGRKRDLAKIATSGCQHLKSKFCIVTYNDTKLIARTNTCNTYQGD